MNSSSTSRTPTKLLFAVLALLLFCAAPLRAQTYGPYFNGSQFIGFDETGFAVFYLPKFGYFTYLGKTPSEQPYPGYLYKYNFGYLYSFGNSGGTAADVYFWDFGQNDRLGYLYTSTDYNSGPNDFLYLYAFSPYNTFMLYYQNSFKPRVFYDFTKNDYTFLN